MVGAWNNNRAHYRCKLTVADAHLAAAGHPASIYVGEDKIVDRLDDWLGHLFSPVQRQETIDALHDAGEDPTTAARRRAIQDQLRSCDDRLTKYRAALEAGTDPTVVAGWVAEVTAQRTRWEIEMNRAHGRPRLTKEQVGSLVDQMAGIADLLQKAHPADRAEIYNQLGLRLTYRNKERLVIAEAQPESAWSYLGVRGGT
jgi:site-specific DNA recombinase